MGFGGGSQPVEVPPIYTTPTVDRPSHLSAIMSRVAQQRGQSGFGFERTILAGKPGTLLTRERGHGFATPAQIMTPILVAEPPKPPVGGGGGGGGGTGGDEAGTGGGTGGTSGGTGGTSGGTEGGIWNPPKKGRTPEEGPELPAPPEKPWSPPPGGHIPVEGPEIGGGGGGGTTILTGGGERPPHGGSWGNTPKEGPELPHDVPETGGTILTGGSGTGRTWGTTPEEGPEIGGSWTPEEHKPPKKNEPSEKGGGRDEKIICAELHRQGLMDGDIYEADEEFGRMLAERHPLVLAGYQLWARPVVRLMRRSRVVTRLVAVLAKPWANEMVHVMSRSAKRDSAKRDWVGVAMMFVGFPVCGALGLLQRALGRRKGGEWRCRFCRAKAARL